MDRPSIEAKAQGQQYLEPYGVLYSESKKSFGEGWFVALHFLYGEGRVEAFERLRKRITERHSIDLPVAKVASYDSHTEEHNARCLPNTRTALLHDITQWAKDKDGKTIFWLCGMAGTGKLTIARTAAQSFAEAGQLGASFFFKKGEGERGNASRIFLLFRYTIEPKLSACPKVGTELA